MTSSLSLWHKTWWLGSLSWFWPYMSPALMALAASKVEKSKIHSRMVGSEGQRVVTTAVGELLVIGKDVEVEESERKMLRSGRFSHSADRITTASRSKELSRSRNRMAVLYWIPWRIDEGLCTGTPERKMDRNSQGASRYQTFVKEFLKVCQLRAECFLGVRVRAQFPTFAPRGRESICHA